LEREPLGPEQGEAGINGRRIVETPFAGFDLRQRGVQALGGPIGAVRRDRLDDVGDGEDPRLDDDGFRGEAPRIARAVEPLMMLQNGLRDRPGKLDALDDVVAGLRVRSDELDFERA
jgi:hypothetical protein